jgi:cytoskeletal protein CcmA (bactofilin family)
MRDLTASDLDWSEAASVGFETASLVDRHSAFEGNFHSQRDLRIEGELKGSISCDGTLFVAEGARVSATIDAEQVDVAGDVSGEIRCRGRLQILPSGRVRASVSTSGLVIQEGAIFEGQLDMAGMERPAVRPLRGRPSLGPVNVDSGVSERPTGSGTTFIRRLGSPEAAWESNGEPVEPEEERDSKGSAS